MNKKTKAKLHTRLKLIKKYLNTDPSKLNKKEGICYHVFKIKKPNTPFDMEDLLITWPKCYVWASGTKSSSYPVDGISGYRIDQHTNTIWSNPKRIELLDWLIEQTKA